MVKIYNENEIDELVYILKNDGVISVPTDTVYGLCGKIDSKKAYEKLLEIKERPINKAFPIMCADEKQVRKIGLVYKNVEKLISEFMPGPITLILEKNDKLDGYITNGKDTIAVRIATTKALVELIRKVGTPLFMTSANKSGEPECKNIGEIEKLSPLLDGILYGEYSFGKASTIVDCRFGEIKIIRKGPISEKEIRDILSK